MTPEEQLMKFKRDLESLQKAFFANNFQTSQDFNKYSRFNTGLKVPHFSSLPTTCEVGDICEASGKLYICSTADNWVVAGTQS